MKNTIKNFLLKKRIKILKSKKGFSLLEVLIAVGIIAIISAIAVPQYTANKENAAKVAGDTSINNIEKAYKHCIALKSHDECNTLSELNVTCPDCSETISGTKFCAQIEKKAGKIFRACVDFDNGSTIGRAYGGDLLSGIKICKDKVAGCTGGNATKNKTYPQKGARACTDASTDCTAGTYAQSNCPGDTITVTAECSVIDKTKGKCTGGACSR